MNEQEPSAQGNSDSVENIFDEEPLLSHKLPKEKQPSSGIAIRVFFVLALTGIAISLQTHHHGPLFLQPASNHILVIFRTQIAQTFGMDPTRSENGPTYRLPFLEIAREVRFSNRRTVAHVSVGNAEGLAIPEQQVELIWQIDPDSFLQPKMQGLLHSKGLDKLVVAHLTQSVTEMLGQTSINPRNKNAQFDSKALLSRLQSELSVHQVKVTHVGPVTHSISKDLQDAYAELLNLRETLDHEKKRESQLAQVRTERLNTIKVEAEKQLSAMLTEHGAAMSQLQKNIDETNITAQANLTESKLAAETDREIYKLQAQHLNEVYAQRTEHFRSFLASNKKLSPSLSKVSVEGIRRQPMLTPEQQLHRIEASTKGATP